MDLTPENGRQRGLSKPCIRASSAQKHECHTSHPCVVLVLTVDVRPALSQDVGKTPAKSARQSAPIDVTGNWVSYVTEDWRFRMITPPKGDYTRVPLTPDGRKVADGWNPAADEAAGQQCKAYGGAAIMRIPARFRITWHDDQTLRVDSDAGMQTRMFHFSTPPAPRERTWQGQSIASWDAPWRKLVVTTTNVRAGYLRRNGVRTAPMPASLSISSWRLSGKSIRCWS